MTSLSLKKKNTSDLKLSLKNIYVFIIFEGIEQYVFQCFVCLPKQNILGGDLNIRILNC